MCCTTNGIPLTAEHLGKCSAEDVRVEREAKKLDQRQRDALPLRLEAGLTIGFRLSCLCLKRVLRALSFLKAHAPLAPRPTGFSLYASTRSKELQMANPAANYLEINRIIAREWAPTTTVLPANDTERFKTCQTECKLFYDTCKAALCFDDALADKLVGAKVIDGRAVRQRVRTAGAYGVRDEVRCVRLRGYSYLCFFVRSYYFFVRAYTVHTRPYLCFFVRS